MDVNDLRITVTVIGLLLFLVLMAHTYSRRRRADHAEAALLPFVGEAGEAGEAGDAGEAGAAGAAGEGSAPAQPPAHRFAGDRV